MTKCLQWKHTSFLSGARWWDLWCSSFRRLFVFFFFGHNSCFCCGFFVVVVCSSSRLTVPFRRVHCLVLSHFPHPSFFFSFTFLFLASPAFSLLVPPSLYMCGRFSVVFLFSRCLSSELKAIENGPKWRVSWCCGEEWRLLCFRKIHENKENFSFVLLYLTSVSWKASTERRTSALSEISASHLFFIFI